MGFDDSSKAEESIKLYYQGELEPEEKHAKDEKCADEKIVQPELAFERNNWTTGLFGCCGNTDQFESTDCEICCLGSFAPCVLYASNQERLKGDSRVFWEHCWKYAAFFVLGKIFFKANVLAPCHSWPTRSEVRTRFHLESDAKCCFTNPSPDCERGCDCLVHFCCHGCALCQEAREIRRRLPRPTSVPNVPLCASHVVAPTVQTMTHK
eukprot:TRINITY_DN2024_c0_g1_i1.p2 TRINITY_DN2024_c0_g1~~TRINITY_DN2024_c0_g1_i1.p2  ORF type:complete len:209 (-),score=5.21 TRINITY_DN2024_c0_g1_i1:328-954(-)